MKTRVIKTVIISLYLPIIVLSGYVTETRAEGRWDNVNYEFNPGESNKVVGPNQSYTSRKPESGDWTASYELRNHFANLSGSDICVYSAQVVRFIDFLVSSGNGGMNSHLYFKIVLSKPVTVVTWDLPDTHTNITGGARVAARYSTDATNWLDAYIYPTGGKDPQPVTFSLKEPSNVVYIGWEAVVPSGDQGYWHHNNTGTLTFTPVQKSPDIVPEAKSRAPGELASGNAPMSEPSNRDLEGERFVPNSFFGTTTHLNLPFWIQLLDDLNIHTVRLDFRYFQLISAPGQYAFSPDNWMIKSADLGIKHGLDQLVIISQPPEWVAGKHGTFPNDQSVDAFEEFMYQIATKYKGKIRYWEAMNEPNMAVWKDRFVIFLKAFYKGVKRADPENKVVLCGFGGDEPSQLEALYRLGGKDYFDILGSHSYTRPKQPEDGGYVGKIEALHRVMKKNGDDKPLWVTEIGWCGLEPSMLEYLRAKFSYHRNYSCTEEDQARALARVYLISAAIPWIERVYFYQIQGTSPYTSVVEDGEGNMGLYSTWLKSGEEHQGQIRPKDAYFAVKTVVEMINESTYKERIDMGSRLWALIFQRGSEASIALWSLDEDVTMILKDASMVESVTSMVGTPILVTDNKLFLSGRPIYLKTPLKNLDQVKREIQQATLHGSGTFQLALGLDLQKTKTDKPVVEVKVINTGNRTRTQPKIYLQAHSPSWELSQDQILDDEPLPAGEEKSYAIAMKGPTAKGGEIAFDVSARLLDGATESKSERTVRYIVVEAKPDNFIADGKLNEWAKMTPIEIGKTPSQREFINWGGPQDCLVQWYCAYDQQALYFAAEVKDDIHYQSVDSANIDGMWSNDSIQIGLDVAGDAQPVSNVPQYDGVNDFEFGLALGTQGPVAYFWSNPKGEPGAVRFRDYKVVRDESSKVTGYEVAIPWSMLGLDSVLVGHWMGMNVLVNDNDGEGRRGWLEWAPGIGSTKDPSYFPKVLIKGG